MRTVHAWFSPSEALRDGSSIYRTLGGCTVSVTRISPHKQGPGFYPPDEIYAGEVVRAEYGGCVRPKIWQAYLSPRTSSQYA